MSRDFVFLFPGLGNHYINMGRELYEREAVFGTAVDRCAVLLQPHLGLDLRELIFVDAPPAPASGRPAAGLNLRQMLGRESSAVNPAGERLQQTAVAQPALFTIEYALVQLLQAHGIRPAALLGYSIGEYVAAHLAGVFSLEDALFLVATRARLIQALPAGKMLAVPLSETQLRPYLNDDLAVSAVNGESLSVVAGRPPAVAAVAAQLAGQSIASQPLPTTHAFHTEMMRPIGPELMAAARRVTFKAPAVPYVSNLSGDWITADQAMSPAYWLEHTCRPVRFAAGFTTLRQAGHPVFVEVGPGQALTSLVTALARHQSVRAIAVMRYEYDGQADTAVLQKALANLQDSAGAAALAGSATPEPAKASTPVLAGNNGSDEIEETLYNIWCTVLKIDDFDRQRSFFEIGGNSLLATQLIFRLRKTFRVDVALRTIFEAPTIGQLAQVVRQRLTANGNTPRVGHQQPTADSQLPTPNYRLATTLPNGLTVFCQSRAEVAHFYEDIFEHRNYLRHGISLPPGSCVFDVGGNIGLFSLFVHLNCPDARIFTFEPAPPLFELLQANMTRHGVAATAFPYALGRRPGSAPLTFYPQSSGMSSLYADLAEERAVLQAIIHNQMRRGEPELQTLMAHADDYFAERLRQEVYTCPVKTVSEMMAEAAVDHIQLLKIDVQKSEYDVLLGIDEQEWPKIDQIVMEVHDIQDQLSTIRTLLAARGYRVIVEQDELYVGSVIYNVYAMRQ
jgi:phthiocerol/phenolphthiocerol synthesis type-I polyketide synthase E